MRRSHTTLSILLIIAAIFWSIYSLMPRRLSIGNVALDSFSVERALTHVKAISKEPHFVGSPAHNEVRQYIVTELNKMGLETQIQEGYNAGVFDNLCKVQNIIARIKGTEGNKSLILLAHYDSSPNSSLGASDDASGVAVILETVRGYLAGKEKPKNDIIILFSDAEELGLNGAQLFVSKHTWAKEVGLVLNFEAGGSGGVSSMLIETNGGNSRMIKNFVKANPKYPFANSLVYTIYKLLPSDMDLTVFRKDGNIEGFNFGCFDDKFDYHTKTDNYERLDRNTLEHQGSYSMPVLKYFAKENLNDLKSKDDFVYFNFPFLRLVFYPYSWTVPMLLIAIAAFVGLLIWGRKKAKINLVEVGKGFIPFILSLIICCAIGYFSWPILKGIYPHYNNIQYPFTYNGHSYIAAVIFLSIGICFLLYSKSNKLKTANLVVAPIFFWLVTCSVITIYVKGASFFLIPVYGLLVSFFFLVRQETPNAFLLVLLSIPALWIFPPFLEMFPVAMGLGMMAISTVFSVLIFGLLLPVFGFYTIKKWIGIFALIVGIGFLSWAHMNSASTSERPDQTSLVYLLDADKNEAYWASYNKVVDKWSGQFIAENKSSVTSKSDFNSKYQTRFSYVSPARVQNIPVPVVHVSLDTTIDNVRQFGLIVSSQRKVNTLEIFTNPVNIVSCSINGIPLTKEYLEKRSTRLIRHFISDNDSTLLDITISKEQPLEISLFESSFDLLDQKQFSVPKRPANAIPMPFELNDAVIVWKSFKF